MEIEPIEVVLFDLGGVLVELGGVAPMMQLAGIQNDDELWRRWLSCRWVRTFERGGCSPDEFAAGVIADWELSVEPQAFLDAFRDWPVGPLPGAEALVEQVHARVPIGCLSNTNPLHWDDHFGQWALFDDFDFRFLSYELGVVKPDRELFDRVAALLLAAPGRVLFLDDNIINVEGAAEAGFVARHARGVVEARAELVAAGVIAA